ncbi:MAG: hypothetical protein BroJett029_04520 [Alphaproteobacteria bacterium]|nr:MAG: hypothetical protein BroJett029_04520 [Alphaproteobacteria bacterium]
MSLIKSPENQDTALGRDLLHAARYYLGRRSALLALAAIALAAGLAFNWSSLVAAGIAPLLLGVLPCVAMCALGLCMNKMAGRSCSTDAATNKAAELPDEERTPVALVQKPVALPESPAQMLYSDPVPASTLQPETVEKRRKIDA